MNGLTVATGATIVDLRENSNVFEPFMFTVSWSLFSFHSKETLIIEPEKNASRIESLEQEKADEEEEGKKDESSCSSEEDEEDDSESEGEAGKMRSMHTFVMVVLFLQFEVTQEQAFCTDWLLHSCCVCLGNLGVYCCLPVRRLWLTSASCWCAFRFEEEDIEASQSVLGPYRTVQIELSVFPAVQEHSYWVLCFVSLEGWLCQPPRFSLSAQGKEGLLRQATLLWGYGTIGWFWEIWRYGKVQYNKHSCS